MAGVTNGTSPDWMAKRLRAIGQKPISALVDITNFINFEFGNPCHVFDLSKLAGSQLVVRFAADGDAVGDVRAGSVKRVASAVGEGSVVISRVWDWLQERA